MGYENLCNEFMKENIATRIPITTITMMMTKISTTMMKIMATKTTENGMKKINKIITCYVSEKIEN